MNFNYIYITCRTTLHTAVFNDHYDCVEMLLHYDVEVNVFDTLQRTALMIAAIRGNQKSIGLFLNFITFSYTDKLKI